MKKPVITYDAEIILKFASRLYSRAASIVYTYTLFGAILGALFGGIFFNITKLNRDFAPLFGILGGAILFGLIGFSIARERAFKLKLEAQNALCQVQIEKNTHNFLVK